MKQIYTHLGALLFLIIFVVSCTKDAPTSELYEGENFYYFSVEEASVLESAPDQVAVVVHYSTKDGGSGSASFSVNTTLSTAIIDTDYTIVNSSSDLSFNSDNGFSDTVYLQLIDNEEFTGGVIEVIIDLVDTQNGKAGFVGPANFKSSTKILIQDDDCPTRNIAGEYTSTTTGTSTDGCCPDVTTVDGEVQISEISTGEYLISDWSAGIYVTWYEIYGITPDFAASGGLNTQVSVLCNDMSAAFNEPFGETASITGKVDLDTGIITYSWLNGYGDQASVTLTPK